MHQRKHNFDINSMRHDYLNVVWGSCYFILLSSTSNYCILHLFKNNDSSICSLPQINVISNA